jgi:hypothetical protein
LSRPSRLLETILLDYKVLGGLSYGPPWAHYLGGYQDRLLGGPLGLLGLCRTTPDGVRRKDSVVKYSDRKLYMFCTV